MKENKKTVNIQQKRSARSDRKKTNKQENGFNGLATKHSERRSLHDGQESSPSVTDSSAGAESHVNENMGVHCVDDLTGFEETQRDIEVTKVAIDGLKDENTYYEDSIELGKEGKEGSEIESVTCERKKVEDAVKAFKSSSEGDSLKSHPSGRRRILDEERKKLRAKLLHNCIKKLAKSGRWPSKANSRFDSEIDSHVLDVDDEPLLESSNGPVNMATEAVKEVDTSRDNLQCDDKDSLQCDDEALDVEENLEEDDEASLNQRIELEMRTRKLEEELRECAALEFSIYSVVSEHRSSLHIVYEPSWNLSRVYIQACINSSDEKRATISESILSGFVLIAKSCGHDVSRLTFWLSNMIVLREIICQALGSLRYSGSLGNKFQVKPEREEQKYVSGRIQDELSQLPCDSLEAGNFIDALEKAESWIFSRLVDSVWWQVFIPAMQTSVEASIKPKIQDKLMGSTLGNQRHSSLSISLWRKAFREALKQLCPLRSCGQVCCCLPVLGRMVMEECLARLDIAFFNAILRESAHDVPNDPVSDPVVNIEVLPIPAGCLSFGSGAQLKNSVKNWSSWLDRTFRMNACLVDDHDSHDNNHFNGVNKCPTYFPLLLQLSDFLMLPKTMLVKPSIRKEVCPSISLSLITRILRNFNPDEFCPAVPGHVLEILDAEGIMEHQTLREDQVNSPYEVIPIAYSPPSAAYVAQKVAESKGSQFMSEAHSRKMLNYNDLQDLYHHLNLAMNGSPSREPSDEHLNKNGVHTSICTDNTCSSSIKDRYQLIQEIWSVSSSIKARYQLMQEIWSA